MPCSCRLAEAASHDSCCQQRTVKGLAVLCVYKGDHVMWHAGVAEGTAALDWGEG